VETKNGKICHCGQAFHHICQGSHPTSYAVFACSDNCYQELCSIVHLKSKLEEAKNEIVALKSQLYEYRKSELGLSDEKVENSYASVVASGEKYQQQQALYQQTHNTHAYYTPPQHFNHFNPHTHTTRMLHHTSHNTQAHDARATHTRPTHHPPHTSNTTRRTSTQHPKDYNKRMQRFVQHSSSTSARTTKSYNEHQMVYRYYEDKMAVKLKVNWKIEMQERKEKQPNVVILNCPDDMPTKILEKSERGDPSKNKDLEKIREFVKEFGLNTMAVTEVFRMGHTGPQRANTRPLKIKCNGDDELKQFFLDRGIVKKLNEFFKCNSIKTRRDKTLLERVSSRNVYLHFYKDYSKDLFPEEGTTPFHGKGRGKH